MTWDDDGPRLWGPYATTAACALGGLGLRIASGPGAVAVGALVLLAPAVWIAAAHAVGRPVGGVDRAVEVGYVAGVSAALAGWTAAAGAVAWPAAALLTTATVAVAAGWVAYGPWRRVTGLAAGFGVAAGAVTGAGLNPTGAGGLVRWLAAWMVGTTAAAVPYWLHARQRRANRPPEVDVDRLTKAIAKHLHTPITQVPHSLNVADHGRYSVRYRLSDGRTANSVQLIIPAVESELGLRPGAVMAVGSRHRRDEVTVTVVPVEPTVKADMPELPTSITRPAPLGRHDDGAPMSVAIYDETGARGALVGGRKGTGKSRSLSTLLKSWTRCEDVLIVFADLSGGATSEPWLPCLHWRETTVDGARRMLDALMGEAVARAGVLPEHGWESWQPSSRYPAVVLVIDEVQRLCKNDWQARTTLENLMQVDRKSGISCVLLCPNPVALEGVSPTVRENAALRLCFGSSGQATKWVLGDTPAAPISYVVTEFDQPGQVLGHGPGLAPVPGRTFDTDLAEARRVAEAHARFRPAPDGLLTPALRAAGRGGGSGGGGQTSPDPAEVAPVPAQEGDDAGLRDVLREMASGPGVLGREWPQVPQVEPGRRLPTEQALQVVAAMVRQPGGASPADIMRATGRGKSWVHDRLRQWADEGLVENVEHGRWRAVEVSAA